LRTVPMGDDEARLFIERHYGARAAHAGRAVPDEFGRPRSVVAGIVPPGCWEVVSMAKRRTLELCERAREELRAYRDRDGRPQARERCAAVPKVADGESPHAVARRGRL